MSIFSIDSKELLVSSANAFPIDWEAKYIMKKARIMVTGNANENIFNWGAALVIIPIAMFVSKSVPTTGSIINPPV